MRYYITTSTSKDKIAMACVLAAIKSHERPTIKEIRAFAAECRVNHALTDVAIDMLKTIDAIAIEKQKTKGRPINIYHAKNIEGNVFLAEYVFSFSEKGIVAPVTPGNLRAFRSIARIIKNKTITEERAHVLLGLSLSGIVTV
jgi:hypothetical protein